MSLRLKLCLCLRCHKEVDPFSPDTVRDNVPFLSDSLSGFSHRECHSLTSDSDQLITDIGAQIGALRRHRQELVKARNAQIRALLRATPEGTK
jgi:hypothetical protein